MERDLLSTTRKALIINLDPSVYGTIAEIGGSQEVARQYFQAGGASGTIAKSISAYDKLFSDRLYNHNKPGKYVSEGRLCKMLDAEFHELIGLLTEKREIPTRFFAFANTVATLNFNKANYSHGWIGMRFQQDPGADPNEVLFHVNLLEQDTLLQQQTLGILGVNLIYACYHFIQSPVDFILSLMDNISRDRIEITLMRMRGPDLDYVDNRLLGVQLVKNGMTSSMIFDRHGKIQQPADMLYKKNVLLFRGAFRPIHNVGFDMLRASYRIFKRDEDYNRDNTLALCEISVNNLLRKGDIDERDFLERVDLLNGMGQNVMISTFREYYKLVTYFSQFAITNLRIVIGIPTFLNVINEKYYTDLRGGILEAFGKIFIDNVKVYIYPTIPAVSIDTREAVGELLTSKDILLSKEQEDLYHYLVKNRKIIDITNVKKEWLYINSANVLRMIREGEPGWEKMVPNYVEKEIKEKGLFGYRR
ncbi:MAG: TonB-dependent receptor [Bacteroidetes bacterium]|nr:MAG: TonB-dependent receptor [Bacteroidota bacterium]